jgi:hypothetical protein
MRTAQNPRQRFYDAAHAARELTLFATHSPMLYDERLKNQNQIKFDLEHGRYSESHWYRQWRVFFDHVATEYGREFPDFGSPAVIFPAEARDIATRSWAKAELDRVSRGAVGRVVPLGGGSKPNPLARKDYRRHAAIQKDLERYYQDCMTSNTAKRFRSLPRRKSYCSAVSWKRIHMANRYPDYFKENPLTHKQTDILLVAGIIAVGILGFSITFKI